MKLSFPDAVDRVRDEIVGPGLTAEDQVAYINDPKRDEEAKAIAPCVDRLANYEVYPPADGRGVGRFAPKSLVPPIADLIGRDNLERLDEETTDSLTDAITLSTAVGYLAMAGIEVAASTPEPVLILRRFGSYGLSG